MKSYSNNSRFRIILYLLPSVAVTLLLTGYGIAYAFMNSIEDDGIGTYVSVMGHTLFQSSIFFSLKIATVATILSLLLGIAVAKIIYTYFKTSSLKLVIWLPMLIPHFVAAYLILIFLSQSGLISSLLYQVGVITDMTDFPVLVFDQNGIGIIVTYIWKSVPFVVLMLLPVYYEIDHRYAQVVQTLGGNRFQVFKTVEWPWIFPIIVEVGLILFAFIIAAFEVPYLLGVTNPKMVSVLAYQWFYTGDWSYRSMSMALMLLITIFILIFSYVIFQMTKSKRFLMMKGR